MVNETFLEGLGENLAIENVIGLASEAGNMDVIGRIVGEIVTIARGTESAKTDFEGGIADEIVSVIEIVIADAIGIGIEMIDDVTET